MATQTPAYQTVSESFARIGRSIYDPLQTKCLRLRYLRELIWNEAHDKNAFLKDQNDIIYAIRLGICKVEIAEMVSLFQAMPYSPKLRKHAGDQARSAALTLRHSPAVQKMHRQWPLLDHQDRMNCLKDISRIMIRVLNDQDFLLINDPIIGKATMANGAAMQVETDKSATFHLVSVSSSTLDLEDFFQVISLLWHEHTHIYMSHLRDAFDQKRIPYNHNLYDDARKVSLLAAHRVIGNIVLSRDIYQSEPEEKLCYFTQDVFYTTLRYQPPANSMAMRHG